MTTTYQKTCPKGHTATFDDNMKEQFCMCGERYDCTMDAHCDCDDCKKENVKMD